MAGHDGLSYKTEDWWGKFVFGPRRRRGWSFRPGRTGHSIRDWQDFHPDWLVFHPGWLVIHPNWVVFHTSWQVFYRRRREPM